MKGSFVKSFSCFFMNLLENFTVIFPASPGRLPKNQIAIKEELRLSILSQNFHKIRRSSPAASRRNRQLSTEQYWTPSEYYQLKTTESSHVISERTNLENRNFTFRKRSCQINITCKIKVQDDKILKMVLDTDTSFWQNCFISHIRVVFREQKRC